MEKQFWKQSCPWTQACYVMSSVPLSVSLTLWQGGKRTVKQPRSNNIVSMRTAGRPTVSNRGYYCSSPDIKVSVGKRSQGPGKLIHGKKAQSEIPADGLNPSTRLLLDVVRAQFGDVISACSICSFTWKPHPRDTLPRTLWGIPAECLNGASPVSFCWSFEHLIWWCLANDPSICYLLFFYFGFLIYLISLFIQRKSMATIDYSLYYLKHRLSH